MLFYFAGNCVDIYFQSFFFHTNFIFLPQNLAQDEIYIFLIRYNLLIILTLRYRTVQINGIL